MARLLDRCLPGDRRLTAVVEDPRPGGQLREEQRPHTRLAFLSRRPFVLKKMIASV